MRTQADIVGEIARAFQMAEVNVIQFACKMLLGLQDIDTNWQEPRGDRLYFRIESLAHAERYCTDPSLRWRRCDNVVTCHLQHC